KAPSPRMGSGPRSLQSYNPDKKRGQSTWDAGFSRTASRLRPTGGTFCRPDATKDCPLRRPRQPSTLTAPPLLVHFHTSSQPVISPEFIKIFSPNRVVEQPSLGGGENILLGSVVSLTKGVFR